MNTFNAKIKATGRKQTMEIKRPTYLRRAQAVLPRSVSAPVSRLAVKNPVMALPDMPSVRPNKNTARAGVYLTLASLICFELFVGLFNAYLTRPANYTLSSQAETLLTEPYGLYAQQLVYESEAQAYQYNKGWQPGQEMAGQNGGPKFSATFYSDTKKGIDIYDPVNKVTTNLIPRFSLAEPKKSDNRLIYPIYGKDAQMVYTLGGGMVKEDIILNKYQGDELNFKYQLNVPDGTEARVEKDGGLGIYGVDAALLGNVTTASNKDAQLLQKARQKGKKDNLLFAIPAPIINEKDKTTSSAQAHFSLEGDVLTVHIKKLKNAHYPLSVDPSVVITTASEFMQGNNESNVDFDVANQLIQKGKTTGAKFNSWTSTMNINAVRWNHGTVVAGGYIYVIGGISAARYAKSVYSTAGANTFTVPAGVTSITVKMWGGGGGGGGGGSVSLGGTGGGGGFSQATLSVTPSETLDVYVGGAGGAGTGRSDSGNGGGGGGHSEIERSGTSLIIAAGGGGGGGGDNNGAGTPGGSGGAGGDTTSGVAGGASGSAGGGGGGGSGSGGTAGSGGGNPGTAGSAETGGAGADGRSAAGADGGANNGGNHNGDGDGGTGSVTNNYAGGGGGGSGRFGGGGGSGSTNNNAGGGGGGGGSSYTTGTSTSSSAGSGTTPGNSSDSDRGTAGQGGTGGDTTATGTGGTDGIVVITYTIGSGTNTVQSSVYWAKFNTTNYTIESPNPGAGTCAAWCTDSSYDLPDARAGFSVVSYNGFIYVMGGVNSGGTRQSTVYMAKLGANGEPQLWNPIGGSATAWFSDASMNLGTAKSYTAAAAYNNTLYLLGGSTVASPGGITTVEKAAIKPTGGLDTWTTSGTTILPGASGRFGHDVQIYNDRMYLIGGNMNGTLQNTVHYIKLNSDGSMASSWISTNGFSTGLMTWGGTFTAVWGAYIYLAGGCSAVNGSGYCTAVSSTIKIASINADGSLDKWQTLSNVTTPRMGYGLVAWRSTIYEVGGCYVQDGSSGDCTGGDYDASYGRINQDGDSDIVNSSVDNATSPCNSGTPTSCDTPSSEVGNVLSATAIINGFLYVIGGCTNNACTTVSGGVVYTAIASDGTLTQPSSCPGGSVVDSYCSSTSTIPSGVGAAGTAIFNGRIYVVGGFVSKNAIYYSKVNDNGSLPAWTSVSMSGIGATSVAYAYAYARANPSSSATTPGNLFIFGGCTSPTGVGCSTFSQAVYKCDIDNSGAPSGCSTSGQLQIGTITGASGAGLGAHAGTVYANYIYLIGGLAPSVNDSKTLRYAKFDNSNNVVAANGSGWYESPNQTNQGRRRGAAFGYNGYIYVVGGYDGTGGGGVLNQIEYAKVDVSDGSIGSFSIASANLTQRWGLSVPVSNSYAYVVGGCITGAAPSSCSVRTNNIQTVRLYNNDSGTPAAYAASANQLSTDRLGAGSTIMNGYIYVAGGCSGTTECSSLTNSTQFASIDSNTGAISSWSAGGNLPASIAWGKLLAAGGTLYYVGGQTGAANTTAVSTVYFTSGISSGNPTWNGSAASGGVGDTSGQAAQTRTQFGAAVWNNRIYVVGGYSSAGTVQSTVYYTPSLSGGGNIAADSWGSTTAFNVARAGTTAVAYANNLYLLGGDDGTNYFNDVQYTQINSDATLDSWTYSTSLPLNVSQGDGFAVNGYMYLFGGRSSPGNCLNKTLVAPISANTTIASGNNPTGVGEWFETNSRFTDGRYGLGANYYNGKAYITGGGCAVYPTLDPPTLTLFNSDSGTHNVSMPSTVSSGDLLLTLFTTDGNPTVTATGWTSIGNQTGSTNQVRGWVWAKVAAGTEGGTTVNFSTGGTSERAAAQVYRVPASQWSGTLAGVEMAGFDSGSSSGPNPPSLNPGAWGTENTTWLAYIAGSTYTAVTTWPTSYLDGIHGNTGTTTNVGASVSASSLQAATASQDPAAYTMSSSTNGAAITVAIRPPSTSETYPGSGNRVVQTALLSQPQIAKYSRMIDLDTDAFPNKYLANGLDNGIGASWNLNYKSSTAANAAWGLNTDVGAITLGTAGTYTPIDGSGTNTDFARYYYLVLNIDASKTFGYPEDVARGPTIDDLTLFFTADPSKRMRHGKTFTGGILQPLDTPF